MNIREEANDGRSQSLEGDFHKNEEWELRDGYREFPAGRTAVVLDIEK